MKLTSTSEPASMMRDVEGDAVHHRLRETNSRRVASRPSISAAPRNSGTRNTRILAIDGLEHGQQHAAGRELADIGGDADREAPACSRPAAAMPQGANRQAISET